MRVSHDIDVDALIVGAGPACPQEAISPDFNAPEEMAEFVEDNLRFFTETLPSRAEPIGAANGSAAVGHIAADTELVRTWGAE